MHNKSFSIILMNNNRSKAYLQNFIRLRKFPDYALILGVVDDLKEKRNPQVQKIPGISCWFDSEEDVRETLLQNNINYTAFSHLDVNAPDVIACVKKISSDYIVYSGPPGAILRDEILDTEKKFVHAHPGLLPDFKGSTTLYYSMLLSQSIGCSVIEMNREIDCGSIYLTRSYRIPPPVVNFDIVVDPLIRTETLIAWLQDNSNPIQQEKKGNTFYIIHPVLKHLARKVRDDKKCMEGSDQLC